MNKIFNSVFSGLLLFLFISMFSSTATISSVAVEDTVTMDSITYFYIDSLDYYDAQAVVNTDITTVTIPAQINGKEVEVSSNIFSKCYKLTEINVDESNTHNFSIDGVLFYNQNVLVAYPCAKKESAYSVPTNISTILSAFENCKYLQSITFSSNVQSIWTNAFAHCPNLEYINGKIQGTVGNPVQDCPKLKNLHFKGQNPFLVLVNLKSLETIEFDADTTVTRFQIDGLPLLKEINVPIISKGTNDWNMYIANCESLEKINLNNQSDFFLTNPFTIADCPNLKEIAIFHTPDNSTEVPINLSNLPCLEKVIYYEPESYIQGIEDLKRNLNENYNVESLSLKELEEISSFTIPCFQISNNCNNFTVYGHNSNEILKYSCNKYNISFVSFETVSEQQKGDVNGDEKIDILDVIAINKAVLGKEHLTDSQNKAADVNKNGKVDSSDSLMTMKFIVGLINSFDA